MVEYIRSDLQFILDQIKIAEAHAAGQPLYGPGGLIPVYNLSWGLRTVDGSYNNLLHGREYWGASNQPFTTHVDPVYKTFLVDPDGAGPAGLVPMNYTPTLTDPDGPGRAVAGDVYDPALRTISNLIVDQTLSNPAAIIESMRRDGVEGDLLSIATVVKAAYEPLKPLFKAVDSAADAYSEAKAAAAVNPSPANNAAAEARRADLEAAEEDLAAARAVDADGTGPGLSFDALLEKYGIELSGANVILPNVATDEGLSAPFNSWFTLFGQFFDHGLDLVNKGGSGTVFIPLKPDDPLYDAGPDGIAGNADDSRTNFMVLTRATVAPGADGVFGTADDVRPLNTTTPFVDQNQTYTSHPSHQVFLREYAMTPGGPVATGHLIEGGNGGMANWGELKQYTSTHLGIRLEDKDVGSVPLLRTDPYGNFIPGANGFPQVITGIGPDGIPNTADDIVIEGNPAANGGAGISLATAIRTNSAFLADIAHNAVPNGLADGDITVGLDNLTGSNTGVYDNELLDRHFIAGDGRVNENIGLTAVHHIFHAEHNRMVEHTKSVVLADAAAMLAAGATQTEAVAFLNEWLLVDRATVPADATAINGLTWDGERLFQAAKFGTEMQYQHLVFEEFARKIQPSINVFIVPDGYDADINPSIMAEFAHVVYRFGHSMLNETIDRYSTSFAPDHITLIEGFLNPVAFDDNGTTLDGLAAGDIIRGMTRQVGNQIDEFVTTALRDNLLGLPLDLATINLARGRDTGVPTLNAARRDFYEATSSDPNLKPYASWVDFAAHLKNEASIINFIASYGTHPLITGQSTIEGKRDAALAIITGNTVGGIAPPSDAQAFLNATGAYAGGKLGGLEDVDLWIGGLAEQTMPFGGMLGSTFNFVFEVQMESLQNGDRFYYLQRNTGQHLFESLEANSFASLIMRHTNTTHLPTDVFSAPGLILEVDKTKQYNDLDGDGDLEQEDPTSGNLLTRLVIRDNPATSGSDTNYLRYTGDEHVVLGGTNNADILIAGIGDDAVLGDGGNDIIEGGFGNDELQGGDGDDIITDVGGDDVFKGGRGNDSIHSGSGVDLVLAGDGNDFVVLGNDVGSEAFGGQGNDFILSNYTNFEIFGNEGDDWIENGANAAIIGDNLDDGFARDSIRGNDVLIGVGGMFDEFVAEGGDDIMVGSLGAAKMAGMSGYDWGTYKNMAGGVDISLIDGFIFDEAPIDPADIAIQRFESVEGLSGSRFDDRIAGHTFRADERGPGGTDHAFLGSLLDAQGIALINGLGSLLGAGITSWGGDILLGGDGNDEINGLRGDDIIDGDRWLNVRISVRANRDGTGPEIASADSMTELATRMFNGTFSAGQLVIVREILSDNTNLTGALQNYDTAVFQGTLAEYDIEGRTVDAFGVELSAARDVNNDGFISVHDRDDGVTGATVTVNGVTTTLASRRGAIDDTDFLKNIEELRFADQTLVLSGPRMPVPPAVDLHAYELVTSSVQYRDQFTNPVFNNSQGTTAWNTSWVETGDGTNTVGGGQIQTDNNDNNQLRFLGGTTAANDGASITRTVNLAGQTAATLSYNYGYAGIDPGETLTVEFSADGVTFEQVHQVSSGGLTDDSSGGGTPLSFSVGLTGPFTANAAVRFTTSALNLGGENFRVDNVTLAATTSTQVAVNDGSGFTATFTEDGAGVAIARNAGITDPDSANMLMAQVRLTNAQASDLLSIAGTLPAGISSSINTAVAGVITLTLSGSASRAAYQTAIEAVRFSNSSQNPNTTPRNIEVTVNDGRSSSPVAVATVNVVAVNDAPTAVADAVFTNVVAGSPIIIPEWVLLANDSDPEGSVLDVSALSAALGVTGLSLTANPGSVTVVDDATAGGSFIYTASDGALTSSAAVTLTRQGTAQVADDFNGVGAVRSAANNSTGTVAWTTSWSEVNDDANIRTGQIQIDGAGGNGTNQLRFINGDGASIQRGVDLSGASAATLSFAFDKNGIDVGETLQVQFAADGVNFVTLDTITNTNGTNNSGNAAGTLSLALPGTLSAASAIRFVASGISTAGEDIRIDNLRIDYAVANAVVTGTANGEILLGNETGSLFNALGGADRIIAGGGDDTINAGAGDDTIIWSVGDGRDFVDGGANGVVGDRFVVNGDDSVEDYKVYARAEAIAAGIAVLNAATEIVVVRNNVVIAELDGIEEITINTAGGADTTAAIGNFGPTDLFFNTVTVNGGNGADMIDASQLTSAHRLVLNPGTAQPAAATAAGAAAPAAPAAADPFTGIGQSTIDALARGGLLDPVADGFVGSSHNGAFSAAFLAAIEQGFGLRSNMVFDREPARDFAPSDFDHATKFHNLQALHFDAADHLIS